MSSYVWYVGLFLLFRIGGVLYKDQRDALYTFSFISINSLCMFRTGLRRLCRLAASSLST
jgi:hypothetical protein